MTDTVAAPAEQTVDGYRLSFAQERIWFVEQLTPGSSAFTIGTALRVTGRLDPGPLRKAFAALVARHETLRTRFVQRDSGPVQEVLDQVEAPFDVVDLGGFPDPEGEARRRAENHVREGFDLATAPLLRGRLLRIADDRSVLLLSTHHIICDGRSAEILWRDLTELYRAAVRDVPADLPELALQYIDFAEWQRTTVDEQLMAEQLRFWRTELAGTTGAVELPTDRPRPPAPDHVGARATRTVPPALAGKLVELARKEHVSPFMLVLAAFETVLARTSGTGDFCVGTSIGGRTQQEVADVLGCFINLLPIRSDVQGDPTLSELLGRVRQRALAAYANSDIPFERLVEQLVPQRDLSRSPLFDVVLAVEDTWTRPAQVEGATLTPEPIAGDAAQYDLALNVDIDEGGADISVSYATALFDAVNVELFLDRLGDTLTAFTGDVSRHVSQVPLTGPVASTLDRADDRGPAAVGCAGAARLALLGDGSPAAADRIRISQDARSWTAHEIWATAEVHAEFLAGDAARTGGLVAIDDTDGADRLARSVGTWLAGGCAVPLSPGTPGPWLTEVAAVDRPDGAALLTPTVRDGRLGARTLDAYSAARAIGALADVYTLGPDDVVLTVVDASPVEVLALLDGGAELVFAVGELILDAEALAGVLDATGATAALLPPEGWTRLVDNSWSAPGSFRAISSGPLPETTAGRLGGAGARVVTTLSPSDGGAWYATAEQHPGSPQRWTALPGVDVQVLDGIGAPALPRALGELRLLGDAAPTPPGTADLVRATDRGAPLVCGRRDDALLIDGHAVSPSLVESLLCSTAGVLGVAAPPGGRELVGFHKSDASESALVAAVADLLPPHLRPSRWVGIDQLPARPDGSIDRGALTVRAAGAVAQAHGGTIIGPRNHVERALLDGFAHSLGRPDLGIHDDFFESGGTSLAAARLVRELDTAVGQPVPLRMLFQHPTVAELAGALSDADFQSGRRTALQEAALDVTLPDDIRPYGPPRTGPVRCAFVTGATGFVASHLLARLLDDGLERAICLVRGPDDQACADRLRDRLAHYRLDVDLSRVTVVRGDLIEERLGLTPERFAEIADEADVIYHSGAQMNFIRPYRVLQGPNVLGTREMLRLACTGRPTPMHYISTIDSLAGDVIRERQIPIEVGKNDGYVLSKKTAENLVLQAGERGLPVGVYRPWQITSHSRTGAVNPQDQLAMCLAGILLTRVAPQDIPLPLRVLPVDHVVEAIIGLSHEPAAQPPIYHFYNRRITPMELVNAVVEEMGYPLQRVSFPQWRVEVVRRSANQLQGLGALLANDVSQVHLPDDVETLQTEQGLSHVPEWPTHDADLVRQTIRFLADRGTIQPPPVPGQDE